MTTVVEEREAVGPPPEGSERCLAALLLRHASERPGATAMRHKEYGVWNEYTFADYRLRAAAVGMGLVELGVEPGDRVAVHSNNRPEWVWADIGIQGIGAITVGVYPTSPAAEVEYLLGHSETKVLVAEDEEQLDKVMEVRDRLPDLRHIIVIDPRGVKVLDDPMVMTYEQLEELGRTRPPDEWEQRVGEIDPTDCAVIVYTSGTTGPPKGAMISHANMTSAAEIFQGAFEAGPRDEVLSYLPLCHIAERLGSVINALFNGYVVNFGEDVNTFSSDVVEVQPTIFLGVPRVWEKMLATVEIKMADASFVKRAVYRFWTRTGARVARRRMTGHAGLWGRFLGFLGWLMVHRSLRNKLGMGRVRTAISGAAPIAVQVLEFFWALGVPIREGYGQTENTAVCTYTPPDDVRIGRVGRPLPGVEVRIDDSGEILTRSAAVFMGYLKNEEATRETIDEEGWLHTGDVGELDDEGFLTITDRMKDIVITAGGKNISPSEIENKLKVSPYVREAVVIGDRRKYLTALIGIELDTVGDWAARRSIPFTTYEDLSRKPEVHQLVQQWIDTVNAELARVEQLKDFRMIPKELDHEEGELTATQKVKRRAIGDEFSELIEEMYG